GKSFLAKKIYEYAKEIKIIRSNSPYFVLNCADYANNPELVSSMLFGYVKGAYTGADSSHNGLLLQANGGY
ncbi:MAG: sigma-54 factor interaction domain-containing protein, partial [Lactobacillus iners]|nr:sigma-54 factor interaction domain-containing protein [Lactobacillus iners]